MPAGLVPAAHRISTAAVNVINTPKKGGLTGIYLWSLKYCTFYLLVEYHKLGFKDNAFEPKILELG